MKHRADSRAKHWGLQTLQEVSRYARAIKLRECLPQTNHPQMQEVNVKGIPLSSLSTSFSAALPSPVGRIRAVDGYRAWPRRGGAASHFPGGCRFSLNITSSYRLRTNASQLALLFFALYRWLGGSRMHMPGPHVVLPNQSSPYETWLAQVCSEPEPTRNYLHPCSTGFCCVGHDTSRSQRSTPRRGGSPTVTASRLFALRESKTTLLSDGLNFLGMVGRTCRR